MCTFSMQCQVEIRRKIFPTQIAFERLFHTFMLSQVIVRVVDLVTGTAPHEMFGFLMRL